MAKEFYAPSGILDALEDQVDYTFTYKEGNPIPVGCKICGSSMNLTTNNVTCTICPVCAKKIKELIDLLPAIKAALKIHGLV